HDNKVPPMRTRLRKNNHEGSAFMEMAIKMSDAALTIVKNNRSRGVKTLHLIIQGNRDTTTNGCIDSSTTLRTMTNSGLKAPSLNAMFIATRRSIPLVTAAVSNATAKMPTIT